MRPSKFRFPERTATPIKFASPIACEISGRKGPEFPMHVPQPKPTRLNPRASNAGCRPAASRYPATTWEPGDRDVLNHGFLRSPRAMALRAKRPAAIITLGFDVLVQEVIAAKTTSP